MAPSCTRLMLFGSLVLILAFVAKKVYLSEEEEEYGVREQTKAMPSRCCPRVMHGKPSQKKYPWIVSLHRSKKYNKTENSKEKLYNSFYCAGSLISHRWILTAAHCLYDEDTPFRSDEILVYFGGVNLLVKPKGNKIRSIKRIEVHEKYSADDVALGYDIGLLELDRPVTGNNAAISPIGLPDETFNAEHKEFLLTGWGLTEVSKCGASEVLKEVTIEHVTHTQCDTIYQGRIQEHMMCAGKKEGNKYLDGNAGDSGGGVVYQNSENKYIIAGIVSFGHKYEYDTSDGSVCMSDPDSIPPGVYTKVSKFLPFIDRVTKTCGKRGWSNLFGWLG